MAVRDTLKLVKPKTFMKNVPTSRATVTRSLLSYPATGDVVMLTPLGPVAVHVDPVQVTALLASKPFLLASASARSVASLPLPAGMAWLGENWPGMKTTPDRAAAPAARSARLL